jgi:hypothetical protein
MTDANTFDPSRYMTKVGSSDYLEVKWRLVWLRELHPDAVIATELVSHNDQTAVFKATVSIPGGGSATGYGTESLEDFREYFETAETKAVGRALAALGFGTQFCSDFDFAGGAGVVVDAPIDFASTRGRKLAAASDRPSNAPQVATPRQLKYIEDIARERGLDQDQLHAEIEQLYGRPIAQLERRDASAFIERLQARRNVTELAS